MKKRKMNGDFKRKMKCLNCGNENDKNVKFCSRCGAVLDHRATEKKSRGSRKIWILGTILLLGVMVGGIIALLNQKTDDGGEYEKLVDQGNRYLLELDYENAEEMYLEALSIEPKKKEPYTKLAEIYMEQEEYEQARNIAEKAIQELPEEEHEEFEQIIQLAEEAAGDSDEANFSRKEIESSYLDFLHNKEYQPYTEDWMNGEPTGYVLLDIDGDGCEELIISGGDGLGFYNFSLFGFDTTTGEIYAVPIPGNSLFDEDYTGYTAQFYHTMQYSSEYHALVFTELNNGADYDYYGYWKLQDKELQVDFTLWFERGYNSGEITYGITEEETRTNISQSEYEAYGDELTGIEWQELSLGEQAEEIMGNQGNEQDRQNDVAMTSIEEGSYEYANGEKLSEFSVATTDGKPYAMLGFWYNYGDSASQEDFYFEWIDGQWEYEVIGGRSKKSFLLTFSPTENGIHITVTCQEGPYYSWDSDEEDTVWVSADYKKK